MTQNARYVATQRYSMGWTDPHGIFGSGAGTVGTSPVKTAGDELRASMRGAVARMPATALAAAFMEAWRRAIK
jgi:hypothetical protein